MKPGFRSFPLAALALALGLFATAASAGVKGVKGINDYTINAKGSLSTSCGTLPIFTTPLTMTFNVNTAPSTPVVFVFSMCPCSADSFSLKPVTCLLPFTSFSGSTNQSYDLAFCPLIVAPVVMSNAVGDATFNAFVPKQTSTVNIGTQAAVIGLPCSAPQGFTLTQAYTMTFI